MVLFCRENLTGFFFRATFFGTISILFGIGWKKKCARLLYCVVVKMYRVKLQRSERRAVQLAFFFVLGIQWEERKREIRRWWEETTARNSLDGICRSGGGDATTWKEFSNPLKMHSLSFVLSIKFYTGSEWVAGEEGGSELAKKWEKELYEKIFHLEVKLLENVEGMKIGIISGYVFAWHFGGDDKGIRVWWNVVFYVSL